MAGYSTIKHALGLVLTRASAVKPALDTAFARASTAKPALDTAFARASTAKPALDTVLIRAGSVKRALYPVLIRAGNMKRALGLIFIIVACIVGFLSIRGAMPFMPIFGSSMEPTLHSGGLLIIEPVDPQDVKVGDIIVYNVPSMVRDYYNYPPVVAHRVIQIKTQPALSFRTKGDNTGEDPFTIRPQYLRGTVGNQIPGIGLPLLFFQSKQGMIFVIIALTLLAFFLYGGELNKGGRTLHKGIFAPVINEEKRSNRVLTRKIEATEQKIISTEQALEKFAAAIELYAQHLSSHTSAIQGLSEASHELKRSAAEQNRVLAHLMTNVVQPGLKTEELIRGLEPSAPEPEKKVRETWRIIPETEKPASHAEKPVTIPEIPEPVEASSKPIPPGCWRNHQSFNQEASTEKPKKPKYQV